MWPQVAPVVSIMARIDITIETEDHRIEVHTGKLKIQNYATILNFRTGEKIMVDDIQDLIEGLKLLAKEKKGSE